MDFAHQHDIEELVAPRTGPCLSFYIPFFPGSRDAQGDITRLEGIARQAQQLLARRGIRARESDDLLRSLLRLPNDIYEWRHRGKGVAVFVAPKFFRSFRLFGEVREELFINEHFHLRPLLALVSAGDEYFVLQLNQTGQRLLKGNAQGLEETDPLQLPSPRGVALGGGRLVDRPDTGPRPVETNLLEADGSLQSHIGQVAAAVDERLSGVTAPLVLACDSRLASIYRGASRYGHLLDQHIGVSQNLSLAELHAQSWPLVQPALVQNRESHRKRMMLHREGQARHGLADVLPAAMEGRIDALFIDCRAPRWGQLEPDGRVSLHARAERGDDDLLELAVSETLRHRGQVFAVDAEEVEMGDEAEALLRY